MCRRHQLLIFDTQYDIKSGLFITANVELNHTTMNVSFSSSYKADIVKDDKVHTEKFDAEMTHNIPINYCPICGRNLK